jgi:hypothetical protein
MHLNRTVLTYGLVSAAASVAMMFVTLPFIEPATLATADVLGYSSILLSALLVFFGIRSYREHAGGWLAFGRGVSVGVRITLISSLLYAAAFEIMYFKIAPDFGERFSTCMVEHARTAGSSPQQIEDVAAQAALLKRLYDHPATNAALTFATSFPIGLVVSIISAAILKRAER